ncbi:MAG: GTPase Era [Ignavibacteria bacterium]|nr:GTPase Era [Ignavibacteria bacterium]MBK9404883.1 GTPase Era [Ignavibacteria bacterium]
MKNKAGFAAIFGKPNAGKSTLINSLLNFKLSVVNKKVQTTRNKILGILTENNYQIVFIDTPGTLDPKYELQKFMLTEIKTSLEEADVVIHIMDVLNIDYEDLKNTEEKFGDVLSGKKRIVVLNKIDLIDKAKLLPVMEKLTSEFRYDDIVPVSALDNENVDMLKDLIVKDLPEGEFFYDKETLTDKSEKFFVGEIIREKILRFYHEEIPYSVLVNINEFKERSERLVYINADIILERETQKIIVIGKKGEGLKRLGEKARLEIEKFLGRRVYLELFVKVRKDWRNNRNFIRENYNQ